jgi:hypothetical protein
MRVIYGSVLTGAVMGGAGSCTGTAACGVAIISSGRDVLRKTGGRVGGLAMVLIANVGFWTGSLGV